MKLRPYLFLVFALLGLLSPLAAEVAEKTINMPGFIENKGQIKGYDGLPHPEVKFAWQQGAIQLFVLENGLAYQFTRIHYPEGYQKLMTDPKATGNRETLSRLQKQVRTESFRMDMVLKGANANARISTEGRSEDYINFYNHQVPDVHHYDKIIYHDIYPGIDWVIYTKNDEVKYDFVVRPGADPRRIQLEFKHQEGLHLNPNGSLSLNNRLGSITEEAPVSFQNGKNISTKFTLRNNIVSFALGAYNASQTLIIDPVLAWATYYGGTDTDSGLSCATDALGNVYVGGITYSLLGIASGGYQNTYGGNPCDAFLVKFNSAGARLWATYYGGSDREYGYSCAVDPGGNVYLAGETWSPNNIAFNGHQNTLYAIDAFLAKFNSNGALLWGTYYGGNVIETGYSCATDALGNVYLAGQCSSTNNIASGGYQNAMGSPNYFDAFLVKFNSSGVRQWGTYYGGPDNEGATGCATDALGNIYLTGGTASTINVASGGHQNNFGGGVSDAFLVKFDASGLRQWATYYGGNSLDNAGSCALDPTGNVYLAGTTLSTVNIGSGGYQNNFSATPSPNIMDAYLVKFNTNGVRQWGTYYGDVGNDVGRSCATDALGNVYLAGLTNSTVNIASMGYQNSYASSTLSPNDGYLVKFNSAGVRQWGTYYGGPDFDEADGVTVDPSGAVYLSGASQSTTQIASLGFQNTAAGIFDAFLAKFCSNGVQPFIINGNTNVCPGLSQTYSVTPDPNVSAYAWSLPAGWAGSANTNTISVIPNASGTMSLYVTNGCGAGTTQTVNVLVYPAVTVSVTAPSTAVCMGQTMALTATGANSYTWSSGSTNNPLLVSPATSSTYAVSGSANTCSNAATFTLNVNPLPVILVTATHTLICSGESLELVASGANSYTWNSSTWNSGSGNDTIVVNPTANAVYTVSGSYANNCSNSTTVAVSVNLCTGIEQALLSNEFTRIYPNPTSGRVTLECNAAAGLEVYDSLGRTILQGNTKESKVIDLSLFGPGIYILKLFDQPEPRIFKLIVQ